VILIDTSAWVDYLRGDPGRAAAALYRQTRVGGESVRSLVDCLIAAIALRHRALLVHKDRDFEVLGRSVGLHQQSLR
jgi:predicted nucleic acid-binding protein